jgi:hypothetical protein
LRTAAAVRNRRRVCDLLPREHDRRGADQAQIEIRLVMTTDVVPAVRSGLSARRRDEEQQCSDRAGADS